MSAQPSSTTTTHDDASPPPPRPETAREEPTESSTPLEPQSSCMEAQPSNNASVVAGGEATDKEVAALAAQEPPRSPRPETPERNRELRAKLAAAKQHSAELRAKRDAVRDALAAKPTKENVEADIAAADAATAKANEDIEALKKRGEAAKAALEAARSLAARVQRLRNYGQRVTSWIDTELTKSVDASTADSYKELDEELLSSIRNLKKRRDDEVLRLNAMVAEHRENSRILTGGNHTDPNASSNDIKSPKKVTDQPHEDNSNNNNGSQEDPLVSPTRSKAQESARRGVSSSPGQVRHDNVIPLPAQPSAVEVAAWDYEDYVSMNNDARLELNRATATKESKRKLRVELTKSLQNTRRMIEREIQSLTQRQNELAHQLQARRKRVVELEMANSSLASSLQYAHASLKMVWTKPVEECLIAQKGTQPALKEQPASTPTSRKSKSASH